ncbi:phytanoyl-CoA dioxygenase family protein [Candidatus Pseudothioglobus singularis]|nr:phytanoyl-CoA dioxygenase family protein [Candidatus Pseudothioglobus singularis]MDB4847788.1 phytanoyl-CoA dioxygenase family protein [Candidatus Pseudothioglobus singularis]
MNRRDYHIDIMLGHPPEEINIWVPFTDSSLAKSFRILPLEFSLEILDKYNYDMQAVYFAIWNDDKLLDFLNNNSTFVELRPGQALLFDSRCFHASVMNESDFTRVSMDVRIITAKDYDNLPFKYIGTGRRKSQFITGDYYSKIV